MDMLSVLKKMEERGVLDKLKKTRQACRQIFTYAVITGRAEYNPVTDLAGALKSPKQQHFPHLSLAQLGPFRQAIDAYSAAKLPASRHYFSCTSVSEPSNFVLLSGMNLI